MGKKPTSPNSPVMTVKEVAAYLRADENTVYRLARRHTLPGIKIGRSWRFRREDIESFAGSGDKANWRIGS